MFGPQSGQTFLAELDANFPLSGAGKWRITSTRLEPAKPLKRFEKIIFDDGQLMAAVRNGLDLWRCAE